MAKVEPMDSPQYELALQEGENPQPQNVMPMVDIRGKWQEVTVDVIIAMCCLLPGIGFLFGCRLLCKYGPYGSSWLQGKSCKELMGLAYLWLNVVFGPLLTAHSIWRETQAFSKGAVDLRTLVGTWQINLLLDAIWIGSSLAWLILESQRNQIEQSVCEHKKRNKEILEENARAKQLLYKLQGSFPEQFNQETHRKAGSVELCSRSGCVLWASAAVIPFLMFAVFLMGHFVMTPKVHCATRIGREEELNQQECEEAHLTELHFGPLGTFVVPSGLAVWIAIGLQIYLTTLYWKKLMKGVLITTSVHMRMNHRELLLFTALTQSSKGLNSVWSERNWTTLQEIVKGSCRRNSRGPEEDEWKQQLLQKIQDDQIEEKTIVLDSEGEKRNYESVLDLGKAEDIEAWWLLRQYIQIDFMDELAGAECCGVIIMMLVFTFFFVAVMDWLQNHQISCALVLVFELTCALLFAMFELFQACVDINTLWERDNHHTLLDASVASARRDDHKVTRLLESLRNKVAHSDARQELFGVQVTANLRNAWILSLVTLFLSSMWEVGKRFMEEADLEKIEDHIRGVIVNFTNTANYRIAQVGG